MACVRVLLLVAVMAVVLLHAAQAARYRKPPFNGSIFGKRSGIAAYDQLQHDAPPLAAVCRAALDACALCLPSDTDLE